MNSRARWAAGALDLTGDIKAASEYLEIGRVADATGLSTNTIADSLTRREITNPANPRGALCRPVARVGDVPLWSQEQVDEYLRRQAAQEGNDNDLPLVTTAEATERQLVSTEEIATLFDLHDQTVRRWQRYDETYPAAVARRDRNGRSGPPEHVRELAAVLRWAAEKGIEVPGAHTAPAVAS
ncbi:hypothetical protein [Actinophytocola sp.]|uniref:hypothetical protein n=1 Tax=Actinophytocola sp. TaxID=1872138 RepID=UPI002D806A6B|nr:hypothetical protein [Actinophytocola sp.]HET9144050.1 hypothetical protein [Actinophytocola sp.]